MERRKINCGSCKHEELPSGSEACCNCVAGSEWEAKPAAGMVWPPVAGFDPGAPEGDKTNTRLDWGESGPELINVWGEVDPQIRRASIDDDERGPVLAVTRMPLETVIGYAIEGIKDRASKIGLMLTDKTLGEHELFDLIHDLANLHERWDQLETEREALRKAGEHVENRDT